MGSRDDDAWRPAAKHRNHLLYQTNASIRQDLVIYTLEDLQTISNFKLKG